MRLEVTLTSHGSDGTARQGDVIVEVPSDYIGHRRLIGSTIVESSCRMSVTHLTVLRGPGFLLHHGQEWSDYVGLLHLTVERSES